MYYAGGKAKTFHHVINLIPPHDVYIEPFLGLGSVMRAKLPCRVEIGIDLDSRILHRSDLSARPASLIHGDGIEFLEQYGFEGHEVVYCDPPYLPVTRKRSRVYRYDASEADHRRFLELLVTIDANVLISGYDNVLYRDFLQSWNTYRFQAKSHNGLRDETIWYNFSRPKKLHDYRYLGQNYRERQTIRRRLERLKSRIRNLSDQELEHVYEWISSKRGDDAT